MSTPDLSIDGAVATITLRRPKEANRLGPDDLVALAEHIETVNRRDDVLVLRLAATGKHFCSGYDIGRLGASRPVEFEDVANALEDARPATIALLQGGVYGGATDLALACDFRIGHAGIEMFMPAARLGLHFYRRGMERYVSRLGLDASKRLFLTAEKIGGSEMKAIGFLTELVAADLLAEAGDKLSAILAGMAPLAMLGMKKNLNRLARGSLDEQAFQADFHRASHSDDLKEGQAAWAQRRPPVFRGR